MEIIIPSTFGGEERDSKLFAFRVGQLARAIGIFGVRKIIIYRDYDQKLHDKNNARKIEKFLRYIECPPYLRKFLIPFDKELKEANVLPALQIPSHGYSEDFREGYVLKGGNPSFVFCGLKEPVEIPEKLEKGKRVTLKKTKNSYEISEAKGFWTFEIENINLNLKEILIQKKQENKIIIGTSRYGENYQDVKNKIEKISFEKAVVVFGSAWRGLYKIIKNCGVNENQINHFFDIIVNFVPNQNTKTVRTEEALTISLGILNTILKKGK